MSPESNTAGDAGPPENPEWLKSIENVGERSALMVVKTEEGDVRYLIPRISLFDFRPTPPSSNGNGNGKGHNNGHPNGNGRQPE